jgi:hypothetical protein
MTTLLVLTTGQSDVQLVCDGGRRELDTKQCGELYDEIAKRYWSVVAPPTKKATDRAAALPDGDLTLCTPKLEAVLRWFDNDRPSAALIFETRRTLPSDPRLAGAVLAKRLDDGGVKDVHRHAFLEGQARLEDPSKPDEGVIRRQIVAGLSSQIAARLDSVRPDRVVVATTGGLAAANEVIQELVRLHSVGREVVSLEVADGAFASRDDVALTERFHPAAGFRARWHALSLIEKGNLLGAWGAVSHLDGQPGQEWVRVVRWLADFASSLPIADDCDLPSVKHGRMAVRAAIRVELALRAGDVPRAVHGTVACFEAALWDHLNARFERSADPKRRRYFKLTNGDAPQCDKLLRKNDESDDDRKRPFELKDQVDGVDWYWIYDGDGGPAARIAKDFLKADALTKLAHALGSDIRALRNDVAHNEPTPSVMDEARAKMRKAALWSDGDGFLSQPLVRNALHELRVAEPERLLAELMAAVRARLVSVA